MLVRCFKQATQARSTLLAPNPVILPLCGLPPPTTSPPLRPNSQRPYTAHHRKAVCKKLHVTCQQKRRQGMQTESGSKWLGTPYHSVPVGPVHQSQHHINDQNPVTAETNSNISNPFTLLFVLFFSPPTQQCEHAAWGARQSLTPCGH